ncbi:MAG TPA: hypothetical protein VM324_11150 [Egibacteraceae bacterium]|nr:hypothetical protein [Egibacteraceae bacterium]
MPVRSGTRVVSRLLALVVAVGLVVGALALRDRAGQGGPADQRAGGPGTVLCVTELRTVCDALAADDLRVRVEDASATLDALAAGDAPDVDAWLTLRPWPQMARDRRKRAQLPPLLGEDSTALGHSPLILAIWEERADALRQRCDPVAWDCVGEVAGDPWADLGGEAGWGPVKPGHADPGRSAEGLLVLHQATGSRLGRTDYSTRDLEDPGFFSWFAAFQRDLTQAPTGSPLQAMVQFGPARFDVVGAIGADLASLRERAAARTTRLREEEGVPPVAAEVVAVPVGTAAGVAQRITRDVPALLGDGHWEPGAADGRAVPSPVALEALRALWTEVRG